MSVRRRSPERPTTGAKGLEIRSSGKDSRRPPGTGRSGKDTRGSSGGFPSREPAPGRFPSRESAGTTGGTWGERARGRVVGRFVGRDRELARLSELHAVAAESPTLVWIVGPNGVGKTTLVRRFGTGIARRGVRVVECRGAEVSASESIAKYVAEAIASATRPDDVPFGRAVEADVLVIDGSADLHAFVPAIVVGALSYLGPRVLLVVTSRTRPMPCVRASLATVADVAEVHVGPFTPAESGTFLLQHRVSERDHEGIHRITCGHPLALALVAERRAAEDVADGGAFVPDSVARELARELLPEMGCPGTSDAAHVLALARTTDEDLLSIVLPRDHAFRAYESFASSPFVRSGDQGLEPDALVRSAIRSALDAKNPERASTLREALAHRHVSRLAQADDVQGLRRHLLDAWFVAEARGPSGGVELGTSARPTRVLRPTAREHARLTERIADVEGSSSAAAFAHFVARDPDALHVVVGGDGERVGVVLAVSMAGLDAAELARDDRIRTFHGVHVREGARADADTLFFRWLVPLRSAGESVDGSIDVVSIVPFVASEHAATVRRVVVNRPTGGHARRFLDRLGFEPFTSPGSEDSLLGTTLLQDLRACVSGETHPRAALERMLARLVAGMGGTRDAADMCTQTAGEFEELVRDVLAHLHAPRELARSPFHETAMGREARSKGGVVAMLEDVLAEVEASRDYASHAAILRATFFEPAVKQEAVAASLGMPFGTYRYRLRKALTCFAATLWERERRARDACETRFRLARASVRQRFDVT
ncbi:MAG: ATP-binding protein [Polyangiaceae bacterium]